MVHFLNRNIELQNYICNKIYVFGTLNKCLRVPPVVHVARNGFQMQ